MGLTSSDINRKVYSKFRMNGMTHNEAIESFPKRIRAQMLKDLEKDTIESHFGLKPLWFMVILLVVIGIIILSVSV